MLQITVLINAWNINIDLSLSFCSLKVQQIDALMQIRAIRIHTLRTFATLKTDFKWLASQNSQQMY